MATFEAAAAFRGSTAAEEKLFAKESISHSGEGFDRGDVRVGAQFQTATSGAAGTSTISFEASSAASTASDADYIAALVRYSQNVTTEAKKDGRSSKIIRKYLVLYKNYLRLKYYYIFLYIVKLLRKFLIFFSIFSYFHPSGYADVKSKALNKASSIVNSKTTTAVGNFLNEHFPTSEFTLSSGLTNRVKGGVLVVRPLSDPSNITNTIFTQGSLYFSGEGRKTLNLGLGDRFLTLDNKLLLGANIFYDHEFPYDHGRTSLGLEAKSSVGEINYNKYFRHTSTAHSKIIKNIRWSRIMKLVPHFLICHGQKFILVNFIMMQEMVLKI